MLCFLPTCMLSNSDLKNPKCMNQFNNMSKYGHYFPIWYLILYLFLYFLLSSALWH